MSQDNQRAQITVSRRAVLIGSGVVAAIAIAVVVFLLLGRDDNQPAGTDSQVQGSGSPKQVWKDLQALTCQDLSVDPRDADALGATYLGVCGSNSMMVFDDSLTLDTYLDGIGSQCSSQLNYVRGEIWYVSTVDVAVATRLQREGGGRLIDCS